MPFLLGDIFIGNYDRTQDFGANEQRYSSLFNMKGHNGIDFACPNLTPILAAADGWIKEIGSDKYGTFDAGGYGNYIKVVHDGYFTLYAHLNDIQVNLNDRVIAGQLIGHSGNTGFVVPPNSGYHLHFGVAPCDGNGTKTERDNGYSGYIDPMSDRCKWDVKNLKEPVVPGREDATIPVKVEDHRRMVIEGSVGKEILATLLSKEFNGWLGKAGFRLVDLQHIDPEDGKFASMYITAMYQELADLKEKQPEQGIPSIEEVPAEKRTQFVDGVLHLLMKVGILEKKK